MPHRDSAAIRMCERANTLGQGQSRSCVLCVQNTHDRLLVGSIPGCLQIRFGRPTVPCAFKASWEIHRPRRAWMDMPNRFCAHLTRVTQPFHTLWPSNASSRTIRHAYIPGSIGSPAASVPSHTSLEENWPCHTSSPQRFTTESWTDWPSGIDQTHVSLRSSPLSETHWAQASRYRLEAALSAIQILHRHEHIADYNAKVIDEVIRHGACPDSSRLTLGMSPRGPT